MVVETPYRRKHIASHALEAKVVSMKLARVRKVIPNQIWHKITGLDRFTLVLCIMVASYGIIFFYLSILRYYSFRTSAWDLGIYNQAFYTTVRHGMLFYESAELYGNPSGSIFGGHFSPVLMLIVPFYAFYSAPETLLVVQSFAIAIGAIPLFWFAYDKLNSESIGLAFVLMYLLYSPLQGVNIYDFHPQAFFPTFMLFAVYYFVKGKWPRYFLFLVLSLMTIEWAGFVVAFWGLSTFLIYRGLVFSAMRQRTVAHGRILASLSTVALGFAWTYLARIVISTVNPSPPVGFLQGSPWTTLGVNPLDFRLDVFLRSARVYEALAFDWFSKLGLIICLFGPLAFMSILSPEFLVSTIPWFVAALLSNYPPYYQLGYQYPSLVVPFIFIATIIGLKRCLSWNFSFKAREYSKSHIIVSLLVVCSLTFSVFTSPISPLAYRTYANAEFPVITPHDQLLSEVIKLIPREASVLTQYNIFPQVSSRLNAFVLPPPFPAFGPSYYNETLEKIFGYSADYILIDLKSDPAYFAEMDPDLKLVARQVLSKMSDNPNYGLYVSVDGIMIFKREYKSEPILYSPLTLKREYATSNNPKGLIAENGTIFGYPLPSGTYKVTYRLAIEQSDGYVILEVHQREVVLASKKITANDLIIKRNYQTFTLNFTVYRQLADANIEFCVAGDFSSLRVYLDYVEVFQTTFYLH